MTSCTPSTSPRDKNVPQAEFGVFFGAQIQQRTELLLQLDGSKQRQGFRLEYLKGIPRPQTITWELDYPTRRAGPHGPGNAPRAVRSGTAIMPAGADRFEQAIALLPTDFPGTWNIRVNAGEIPVLDRPFRVVTALASDDAAAGNR